MFKNCILFFNKIQLLKNFLMACLITKRGKFYRKIRLDLWGYYAMYYKERISEKRRVDHTVLY